MRKHYDAIIIGFGKGGKTMAGFLAGKGRSVAIIERSSRMYGGTCINIACIPTKSMVHDGQESLVRGLPDFAARSNEYARAVARKEDVTGFLRQKNYAMLADKDNVDVITGTASFLSDHRVAVQTAVEVLDLEGDLIFINTGSEPILPPVPGLKESTRCYTSTTLLDETRLPARLLILGAGYISLEFASMYANFGSKVTLLERGSRFLPREDADVAESVRKALEAQGISVLTNAGISSITDIPGAARVDAIVNGRTQSFEAEAVLVATGRRPVVEGLNLEAAGVQLDAHGAIAVNEHLQTSVPHIYALGDVKGGPQFTYISLDDFRIVRDALFGDGTRTPADRDPAYAVFMNTPLGRAGLTEEAARAQGYAIKVAVLPAAAIPRARLLGATTGMLKAVVDAKNGQILGCALHCVDAGEMINAVQIAMKAHLDASFLRDNIFTHPSMTEALNDLFGALR